MTSKFLPASAIATSILCISGTGLASAALLDFEFDGDYGTSPYDYSTEGKGWKDLKLVNDNSRIYGGLEWATNWEVMSSGMINDFYKSSDASVFPSGNEAVYNGDGDTPMVAKASEFKEFKLGTAEFLAFPWNDGTYSYSATEIEVTGFLDGTKTGSVTLDPLQGGAWEQFNLAELGTMDSFEITYDDSNLDKWWMMDNLEVTAVPIPSSAWLLIAGLGGLFGSRYFGQRKAV